MRRCWPSALILVAIVVLFDGAWETVHAQASSGSFDVGGTVRDGATGQPVPGALVRLTGKTTVNAETDSSGRFLLRGVWTDRYSMQVSRPGWVTTGFGQERPDGFAQLVEVSGPRELSVKTWRLATVSGRVTAQGHALGRIEVAAFRRQFDRGIPRWAKASASSSDERGDYLLTGLAPGDYLFVATIRRATGTSLGFESGYLTFPGSGDSLQINPGDVRQDVTFDFAPAKGAGVRVELPSLDNNASRIEVAISPRVSSGPVCGSNILAVVAPPGGIAQLGQLGPNEYSIVANRSAVSTGQSGLASFVQAISLSEAKDELVPVNLRVTKLKGTVLVEGAGTGPQTVANRMLVTLRPVGSCLDRRTFSVVKDSFSGDVSSGVYSLDISGLHPGWFVKSVELDSGHIEQRLADVSGQGVDLRITVSRNGGSMTGKVIDGRGQPRSDYVVFAIPDRGTIQEKMLDQSRFRQIRVDAAGSFLFSALPPGNYLVGAVPDSACAGCSNPDGLRQFVSRFERFTVTAGQTLTVPISVRPSTEPLEVGIEPTVGGPFVADATQELDQAEPQEPTRVFGRTSVTGAVQDSSGEGLAGIQMKIYPVDELGRSIQRSGQGGAGVVVTNDRGEFKFVGLKPGMYKLVALPPADSDRPRGARIADDQKVVVPGPQLVWSPAVFPAVGPPPSTGFVLSDGQQLIGANVVLRRTPSSSIFGKSGLSTDAGAGQTVRLFAQEPVATLVATVRLTKSSDCFLFSNLPPGNYWAIASLDGESPMGQIALQAISVAPGDINRAVILEPTIVAEIGIALIKTPAAVSLDPWRIELQPIDDLRLTGLPTLTSAANPGVSATFSQVPTMRYSIRVFDPLGRQVALESLSQDGIPNTDLVVQPTPGRRMSIAVALKR